MLVLVKLAEYQDMFLNTLVTIALPWYPQTNADLNIRTGIFKGLAKENENIAWKVLMKLMPNVTTNSTELIAPNYMNEVVLPGHVSQRDYITATKSYVLIAISLLNAKTDRIIDMIEVIDDVSEDLQNEILRAVYDNSILLSDSEKEQIWNKKEDFVKKHRRFADTKWALDEKRLKYIENFLNDIWPDTNKYVITRLFRYNQFSLMDDENWNEGEKKLQDEQIYEVRKLYSLGGIKEILMFENKVENKHLLGKTLGYIFSKEDFNSYIDEQTLDLNSEFNVGLLQSVNREWIFETADAVESKIAAQILASVFVDDDIIVQVQKLDAFAQKIYFQNLRLNSISEMMIEHLLFLMDGINSVERYAALIHVMYEVFNTFDHRPNDEYLIDRLNDVDISCDFSSHELYELQQLLKYTQENCKNRDKLLALEWKYLNILDENDGLYPINLWNEIANSPCFYIELIKTLAGKRSNELSTEEMNKMYSHNYKLLNSCKMIPGQTKDEKYVDCEVLNKWFLEVRKMASDEGILNLAMEYCGKLFFYAHEDESGFFVNKGIAEIIEHEPNAYVRNGYEIGAINSRGCILVDPTGQDDFDAEDIYEKKAKSAEAEGYIRLADSLRRVANSFHEEGLMHQRLYKN